MTRETMFYRCECCGAQFHIDFLTHKVTLVERPGGSKVKELDELVRDQEHDAERREATFREALDRNAQEKDRLEQLFDEARRKVSQEKDPKPPRSPFDLE